MLVSKTKVGIMNLKYILFVYCRIYSMVIISFNSIGVDILITLDLQVHNI